MTNVTMLMLSDTLEFDGAPVLTYKIQYPFFTSSGNPAALSYINDYYSVNAHAFENYCRNDLFYRAAADKKELEAKHFPFFPYEAIENVTITYHSDCVASLFYDRYIFTGGAHGSTVRYSDTWNLENGHRMEAGEFFTSPGYEKDVKNAIIQAIRQFNQANPDSATYFPDYEKNVENTFRKSQFYLTPEGIVFYFQEYDIAPHSSGIPQFLFPFPGKSV